MLPVQFLGQYSPPPADYQVSKYWLFEFIQENLNCFHGE